MGTVFDFVEPYDGFDPEAFVSGLSGGPYTIDYAASEFDLETGDFRLALNETLTSAEILDVTAALDDARSTDVDSVSGAARGTASRIFILGAGTGTGTALYADPAGKLSARAPGGSLQRMAAADPVDPEDVVTLGYLGGGSGGGISEAKIAALRALRAYR